MLKPLLNPADSPALTPFPLGPLGTLPDNNLQTSMHACAEVCTFCLQNPLWRAMFEMIFALLCILFR